MTFDLPADSTAVVTGGASGIGRQICLSLARAGADTVVGDIREKPREGGLPTHELIDRETNSKALFEQCDVSVVDDVRGLINAADEFGGVTILVNNAGICRSRDFLSVSEAAYDELMAVNLKGSFFAAQAAAQQMLAANRTGAIINVSSSAGIRGRATFVDYSASKGGLKTMTYALAAELGPKGIRVNAVHPGLVETTMTTQDFDQVGATSDGPAPEASIPSRRVGRPDDIANAVIYLAGEGASYVNGESLVVDGGVTYTR